MKALNSHNIKDFSEECY